LALLWAARVLALPAAHPAPPAPLPPAAAPGSLSDFDRQQFEQRFATEIWPLLSRSEGGCAACHDAKNPSQLHSPPAPASGFARRPAARRFAAGSPTPLIAPITPPAPATRMPPRPAPQWSEHDVAILRSFCADLYRREGAALAHADEQFPAELRLP